MRAAGLVPAAIVALLVLVADQASKAIVRGQIEAGERVELILGVDLVRVGNDGIAFGLLDGASNVVLVLAALAFLVLLGFFLAGAERFALWLPLGLLAGGALGNLVDRVHQGFVTDFIDPPNWPAFNLADAAITVGVVLLVATYLWGGDPEQS